MRMSGTRFAQTSNSNMSTGGIIKRRLPSHKSTISNGSKSQKSHKIRGRKMKNESVNLTNEMIYTEQASAEFQPTSYVQSNMNTTA